MKSFIALTILAIGAFYLLVVTWGPAAGLNLVIWPYLLYVTLKIVFKLEPDHKKSDLA